MPQFSIRDPLPAPFNPNEGRPGFGSISPGIMPGEWQTLRGPFQLPSSDLNQAMAEYEARLANPRSGIPDDLQANLERELFTPFLVGLGRGANAIGSITAKPVVQKPAQSRNVGGALLERNPLSGEWEVKFQPEPKPKGLDASIKSKIKLLEGEIGEKRRALLKEPDTDKQNKLELDIQDLKFALHRLLNETITIQPPKWLVDPNTIPEGGSIQKPQSASEVSALDMFGKVGSNRTPFTFPPPPVTQTNLTSDLPINPPTKTTVRRRRYNPSTGRLEP